MLPRQKQQETVFLFDHLAHHDLPPEKIKGTLYACEEDFEVFELDKEGRWFDNKTESAAKRRSHRRETIDKAPYQQYTLVKKGINTFDAVHTIARVAQIPPQSIGYCGLKDTFGITTQEITLPTTCTFDYRTCKNAKFFLKNGRPAEKKLTLRENSGNRFRIVVSAVKGNKTQNTRILRRIEAWLRNPILNYYGHQRFGPRQIDHLVGKALLQDRYEDAAKIFLTISRNETEVIREIRNKIAKHWKNWDECKRIIPTHLLPYEQAMISQLQKKPEDFFGGFEKTPLCSFFVNSYSSYPYNRALDEITKKGKRTNHVPLLGYNTVFDDEDTEHVFFTLLAEEGITKEHYAKPQHPAISYEGRNRRAHYTVETFSWQWNEKDLIITFHLPGGVYANHFLEKFIENTNKHHKLQ